MKRKRESVHARPWTEWIRQAPQASDVYVGDQEPPAVSYANSRYHVAIWEDGAPDHPYGEWCHLSIKDHDRSARHDWRDLQRIKNELVGPQYEAIEIYPAESRLVDTCNQYHLYVFRTWRPPMGFDSRLVADGTTTFAAKSVQRPFEVRPPDCLTADAMDRHARETIARARADAAGRLTDEQRVPFATNPAVMQHGPKIVIKDGGAL